MLLKLLYKDLKKQRRWYSGKKKRHTIKTQILIEKISRKIITTFSSPGRRHDFHIFKKSKIKFKSKTKIITDTGYLGIQKLHQNSEVPRKRSKKFPLTKEDKVSNRRIASERMAIENVIGAIKKFKIVLMFIEIGEGDLV